MSRSLADGSRAYYGKIPELCIKERLTWDSDLDRISSYFNPEAICKTEEKAEHLRKAYGWRQESLNGD